MEQSGTIRVMVNVYPQELEEKLIKKQQRLVLDLLIVSTNTDVWNDAGDAEKNSRNKGLQEVTSNIYENGCTGL